MQIEFCINYILRNLRIQNNFYQLLLQKVSAKHTFEIGCHGATALLSRHVAGLR